MKEKLKALITRLKEINYKKALRLQLQIRPHLQGVPYWVAAVAVGLIAVSFSNSFGALIGHSQQILEKNPYAYLVLGPVCFAVATWIVGRYAPAAGGTGIPSVLKALSLDSSASVEIQSLLSLRVASVVILSSLLAVLGGGSLGREGPMVQVAACVFYVIGRQFKKLWPADEHRSWIVAGGAAGLAAAFNTPLAGIVFVLEELTQLHFHQFKTVIISAVIIAGMMSQWLFGRYLFLGYPLVGEVRFSAFPFVIAVGVLCGVAAGLFEQLLTLLRRQTAGVLASNRLLLGALVGLVVALMGIFLGKETVGGGVSLMSELLFRDGYYASWKEMASRFFGPIVASLSGCAGGFLAPSLSLGATIGSRFAAEVTPANHNLLVLVGMSGMLSAISRAPFTALVVVMEMTDRHSVIFPLMLSSLVAQGTVRAIAGRFVK
jgi:H+/Cl- antiporter ClcA